MPLLRPGDPEFDKIEKSAEGVQESLFLEPPSDATEVKFTVLRRPKFELHHAKQPQDSDNTKLILHFKKIARTTMGELGKALHELVHDKLRPPYPIRCLADRSPLADVNLEYRSQWDFIVLNLPSMYVKIYHDAIMKIIMDFE